jgi:tRNA A37 threonylcarbamoyladenosine dehydratase
MRKTMLIAIAFASTFAITSCGNTAQEVESTEVDTTEVVETEVDTLQSDSTLEVEISE